MKYSTSILLFSFVIVTILSSCKKEANKNISKYTYTDDAVTIDDIAVNFFKKTHGGFSISNTGMSGSIGKEIDAPEFTYLKTSFVIINKKKLYPSSYYDGYTYNYPPPTSSPSESLEWQNFFATSNSQPTTNFQLYDTTNNLIIEFICKNPKPITLTIDNQNYREAPPGSRIVMRWNADASNQLGIAIALSGNNGLRYLYSSDNGSLDITDEAIAVGGTDRISVTVTRGVILVGKGADGRDYKLTNRIGVTEIVYI